MPYKSRLQMACPFMAVLILLACGLFTVPNPTPAPIQPADTVAPPRDTPTQLPPPATLPPPTATLPPPSPRATITPIPPPEWVTEFAEPILVEISSRPPDLEDNFGWDTGAWVVAPWGAEWRKSIKNGEIILSQVSVQYQGIKFHDYVVQVRVRRIEAGWHGIEFGNYPVHPPSEVGFSCLFKVLGRNAHFSCSLAGKFTDIDREIATQPIHTFLLIVKGGRIATYLDGKPISYFEDDRYRLYRDIAPSFWLSSGSVHAFSEFKVWNITKLEVP